MPEDNGQTDARPHFVIPYWRATGAGVPDDDGNTRPVPGGIVWYLCGGVHASAYVPGQQLDVTIDVLNFGGGNAAQLAQVTVWWSEPSTGFVLDPSRLIGFQVLPVAPRGGSATTTTMSKVIPASAGPHICLLARVSHQYDRAGAVVDPVGDRHWAQRNLSVVAAQVGAPIVLPFMAGNPLPEEAEFVVSAERAHEGHLETLATQVQKIPVFAEGRFSVAELDGDDHDVLRLRIRPGEAQPLEFRAVLAGELGAEEFAAFQVVQRIEGREAPIGGVGVLVHRG